MGKTVRRLARRETLNLADISLSLLECPQCLMEYILTRMNVGLYTNDNQW